MPAITAVTFDLWQTLLLDSPEVGRVRTQARLKGAQEALRKAGEPQSRAVIETAYQNCARRCQEIREGLTDISFQEQVALFVDGISPGLAARLPAAALREITVAYSDSFFEHPPRPHPAAVTALRQVKARGFRLGLISNTGMTPGVAFRRFMAQHGLLDYFDALTFSDEVKLAKPAPEIFLRTLRALDAVPGQAIHVGDHPITDVMGAGRCGLKTVWIEGFYERAAFADPAAQPDVSVADLGAAAAAVEQLAGGAVVD